MGGRDREEDEPPIWPPCLECGFVTVLMDSYLCVYSESIISGEDSRARQRWRIVTVWILRRALFPSFRTTLWDERKVQY